MYNNGIKRDVGLIRVIIKQENLFPPSRMQAQGIYKIEKIHTMAIQIDINWFCKKLTTYNI